MTSAPQCAAVWQLRSGRTRPDRPGRCRLPGLLCVGVALAFARCASAPPVQAPPLTIRQKLAAIIQLEQQRILRLPAPPAGTAAVEPSPPAPPRPDLPGLLKDTDARVRRRSALAIGRVGLADGVPLLVRALTDPDAEVRQMVAFALGLLHDERAIEPLVGALHDQEPVVQGRAAEALARLGAEPAAPAIGEMVAAYTSAAAAIDPDDLTFPQPPAIEAFRLGVVALARLKAFEPLAAAVLDGNRRPVVRWWPVAWALSEMADRRASTALVELVQGPGTYGVASAARGLGALGDATAADLILPLLDVGRYDSQVVVSAIQALGRLSHPRIAPALLKLATLRDLDPTVRLEAVRALGAHAVLEATDLLLDLLSDPWPAMRGAALRSLAGIDEQTFLLVLSGFDEDPHWSVRAVLADVLGSLNPDVAIPRLRLMLEDRDRRVIPSVLRALASRRAPDLASLAGRLLATDDDPGVRMAAAIQIGALRPAGGMAALAEAYAGSAGQPSAVARRAIVEALARNIDDAEAIATLNLALSDEDWAVRLEAAARLAELDPTTDYVGRIRPAPGVAADQALRLADPDVSPQVYLETDKGTIQIELAVLDAPVTAENFARLAARGFFDSLPFHTVVPAAFIRGGDPRSDGLGGPGYTIRDEINERPFLRGTVGMARNRPETGGSQFFVTLAPQPLMDGRYTAFGRVVTGMDVVDRLTRWDVIRRTRVWDGTSMLGR